MQIEQEVKRRLADPELCGVIDREVGHRMSSTEIQAAVEREVDMRLAAEGLADRFGDIDG